MEKKELTQTVVTTDTERVSLPLDLGFKINLCGPEGNAFYILGMVVDGMRELGLSKELQKRYMDEATSGDYDHLLEVTRKWVHLETI